MKFRLITMALAICFLAPAAMAQDDVQATTETRKIRFGFKVAPNYGWLKPNIKEIEKDGVGGQLGFSYPLMLDFRIGDTPNYWFGTGFEVATNGGELTEAAFQTVDTVNFFGKRSRQYNLQYINIPLTLKMRTNEIGYMTYFFAFGGDLGVNVRSQADDTYTWLGSNALEPDDEEDIDIKSDIQTFRLAMNITAGGEYNLSGKTNLYMALSWRNGFTNILKGNVWQPDNSGNPELDDNGNPIEGPKRKAISNYIALEAGIYF